MQGSVRSSSLNALISRLLLLRQADQNSGSQVMQLETRRTPFSCVVLLLKATALRVPSNQSATLIFVDIMEGMASAVTVR